ncbi:MAG: heavy metal translocating P-type ATPase [Bacteroidota bacterium]
MKDEFTKETTISISDLCCSAEELTVRKKLESLNGIRNLQFNVFSHEVTVSHTVPEVTILQALKEIGLPGVIESRTEPPKPRTSSRQRNTVLISGTLLAVGLAGTFIGSPSAVWNAVFLLAIVTGGASIARKAFASVRNFSLDINFLMTTAVIGAVALGQFAEGAAVIVLYAVSLLLESASIDRTRRAIHSLVDRSPKIALVRQHAEVLTVPIDRVQVGQIIVIKPGSQIPLDGEVVSGNSFVNQSAVTGESLPVLKQRGDSVFGGTLNDRGALDVKVSRLSSDSTLARIIHLVEEAQAQRASHQTFIEKFARIYTPAVFVLSIAVALLPPILFHGSWEEWFYRALVLLVIACPCALLISTPVSIVSALTNAARNGFLVKGGRHLEELATLQALAIDKTGTLTEGNYAISEIVRLDSLSDHELLRIAGALELRSQHPLAAAFGARLALEGVSVDDLSVDQFEAVHGKGVRAKVGGITYILGNHTLTEEMNVCSPSVERILSDMEARGHTVLLLSDEQHVLGAIGLADVVREEGNAAVRDLHDLGIKPVVLLTGDSQSSADRISDLLGIDEVQAGLLPDQKLASIQKLKAEYGRVGMVGDGVNDAPALAAADVSIAMGKAGSDTAIQAADVVLLSDNLTKIPYGIALGRKTIKVIRQNITLALCTKAIFLLLGILGLTNLWLAILADDGATLVVILNGMRLLRTPKR